MPRKLKPTQTPVPSAVDTERAATAAAFLAGQEITNSQCQGCGATVAGVNGRYSCGACGHVNHWSEGSRELPPMEPASDA